MVRFSEPCQKNSMLTNHQAWSSEMGISSGAPFSREAQRFSIQKYWTISWIFRKRLPQTTDAPTIREQDQYPWFRPVTNKRWRIRQASMVFSQSNLISESNTRAQNGGLTSWAMYNFDAEFKVNFASHKSMYGRYSALVIVSSVSRRPRANISAIHYLQQNSRSSTVCEVDTSPSSASGNVRHAPKYTYSPIFGAYFFNHPLIVTLLTTTVCPGLKIFGARARFHELQPHLIRCRKERSGPFLCWLLSQCLLPIQALRNWVYRWLSKNSPHVVISVKKIRINGSGFRFRIRHNVTLSGSPMAIKVQEIVFFPLG